MRQPVRKRNYEIEGAMGMGARGVGELPLPAPALPSPANSAQARARQGKRARPRRVPRSPRAEHREAAWRLSRAIRRAPGPAAQARIGGLVCGHLLAMLREGREDMAAARDPHRTHPPSA